MKHKLLLLIAISLSFSLTLPKKFCADFNETIISNGKKLLYKGKIFYENPYIVWEYDYPYKKTIWIKDKIYIYEPDIMQVTIIQNKKVSLKDIISKAKKIKKDLYVTTINSKKYYFIYNKTLKKLYYKDKFDNNVTITFYNQKKSFSKSVFKINFPKDVDIIYQQ